jgi:hypothetical protein
MKYLKRILLILSLVLNALFVFVVISAFSGSLASVSFHDMDGAETRYTTAAAIVSVPQGREVVYGPFAVSLAAGDRAALQISAISDKRQANRLITPLYDHKVVKITETGFGIIISALEAGTTTLQTLTEEGIVDIAVITVSDSK